VLKRLRLRLSIPILLVILAPWQAQAGPSLLFEPQSGRVLAQDRAGQPWYPASLTKLMTAYLVFEALKQQHLRLDQRIPVSSFANSAPASKIGVPPGNTVSVDFALQTMLVYSANDMAVVLAEAVGPTVSGFVRKMNLTAQRLGMTGSRFVNPNGLHSPRQVSTARDLAVLAGQIFNTFPEYRHYFDQDHVVVGKRRLASTNRLLRTEPSMDGMKTGFTCPSGYNLIASESANGRHMMAIVLGATSSQTRAEWAQHLLAQGFASTPTQQRVSEIGNVALALIEPTNMSNEVCGERRSVTITPATALKGHGAMFGRFGARSDASALLTARVDLGEGFVKGASKGVVRMPGMRGFAAMVWGIDAAKAQSLCSFLHSHRATCEFMSPDRFAGLAEQAQAEEKARMTAEAERKKKKKKK
jgi:D-alanyl-D-alanine carboxypeptidase